MSLARISALLQSRTSRPEGKGRAGFSLLEVTVGMAILSIVFISLASFTRLNRKAMGTNNKALQGYYVGTTWSEAIKTWYADTLDKYGTNPNKKVRFDTLFAKLGSVATKDTFDDGYNRGSTEYFTKMTFSRIGNTADSLILARGEVKWDSVAGVQNKTHKFTWGFILGKPVRVKLN